jgi:hypothetical protein
MTAKILTLLTLGLALTAHAQDKKPVQLCSWIKETRDPDFMNFEFWMQADSEFELYYVIGGQGVVRDSGHDSSPSSGVLLLHPGRPEKMRLWGTTPGGPAKVDISIEVHRRIGPISEQADKPVIAKFLFARNVPESEETPPSTLAKKQCVAIKN